MRLRRGWTAAALAVGIAAAATVPRAKSDDAPPPPGTYWVSTWGASAQPDSKRTFNDVTIRNIVHTSVGGKALRIRITNAFGGSPAAAGDAYDTPPLLVGDVYVGRRSGNTAAVVPETQTQVLFGGKPGVRISPGTDVVSDPVPLSTTDGDTLAVSIYVKGTTPNATYHSNGKQTSYMTRTAAGDHAAETAATNFTSTTSSWWFMDDLSVATDTQLGAVVALGDSITDDANGTSNTNHRWPDFLASRLTSGVVRGVLDEGISGNSILKDYNCCGGNPSALSRLDRDVLSHDGVRTVIVLLGINDLGNYPDDQSNVADIEDGMRQLADRIHRAGVRIEMGTITPFQNATLPGYYDAAKEAKREQLNAFIRSAPYWDGVVDFEKALQDPSNPLMMLPAYDSGDHLHPNDAGNQALANAVQWVESPVIGVSTPAEPVGGTVPATLALAMGPNPSFGAFIPGLAKTYTASTTATVTSTAADATLSVSDPGHLTNGTFALPQPLQVGPLPSWDGPVSNDVKTITFSQAIGASDALRTGTYATTVTFTLSTTSP